MVIGKQNKEELYVALRRRKKLQGHDVLEVGRDVRKGMGYIILAPTVNVFGGSAFKSIVFSLDRLELKKAKFSMYVDATEDDEGKIPKCLSTEGFVQYNLKICFPRNGKPTERNLKYLSDLIKKTDEAIKILQYQVREQEERADICEELSEEWTCQKCLAVNEGEEFECVNCGASDPISPY